ncbi:gephyrin-like molybdotransferase Glp [Methylocystis heyeri]|uniref:Molybdopterin molybdenumtransferase n=1 Tax=Methylocystis heyeri TaxID=391905 RepID=A0A6B8KK54_9HYPH|nr:gephyrin-like molybdotransferase Glp [Methylocystis heyeri]QGM46973.1 molybdopterin molybdenumtransferase MoeA [Methylocystis heyeri]
MAEKKLLGVDEALARILEQAQPLDSPETLPLARALGRTLAKDLMARRTQPPVDVSAMDGYAVRCADFSQPGARARLAGESAAGHGYGAPLKPGECVRIFTGAPVPAGADAILLQEDSIAESGLIGATAAPEPGRHIRTRGLDFLEGAPALGRGIRLGPAELALAAASNHAELCVARRPRVAILASGDELVAPGVEPGPSQIISCNNVAVAGFAESAGAEVIDLGIFRDDLADLKRGLAQARESRADVLVTLGGASVGDHDLLRPALAAEGMTLDFWRIAMRPGKPLIFGRLGEAFVLGLPGNPVASFVCALVFLAPLLRALQGDPEAGADKSERALLGVDLPANKARRDFMRAALSEDSAGRLIATPQPLQDSSLLTELVRSQALLLREIGAPAAGAGDPCRILRLR